MIASLIRSVYTISPGKIEKPLSKNFFFSDNEKWTCQIIRSFSRRLWIFSLQKKFIFVKKSKWPTKEEKQKRAGRGGGGGENLVRQVSCSFCLSFSAVAASEHAQNNKVIKVVMFPLCDFQNRFRNKIRIFFPPSP